MTELKGRNLSEHIDNTEALAPLIPLLRQMEGMSAGNPDYHQEGDLLEHTLRVYEEMREINDSDKALLMALAHDVGKLMTQHQDNDARHDTFGERMIEYVYIEPDVSEELVQAMRYGCEQHLRIKTIDEWAGDQMSPSTLLDTVIYYNTVDVPVKELVDLAQADAQGREPTQSVDCEKISTRLEKASEVVETVDKDYVLDKRDSSRDTYTNAAIEQMIQQDRVELLKEKL